MSNFLKPVNPVYSQKKRIVNDQDGGQYFRDVLAADNEGLTKLELFTLHAMQGLITSGELSSTAVATFALAIAKETLRGLEQEQDNLKKVASPY